MSLPETFDSREAASAAAADLLEAAMRRRLAGAQAATLVVSGGSTPARCLELLAARELDWKRVHVTLTDERCVPPSDEDSNERMVREHLLQGPAAAAGFFPLYRDGMPPGQAVDAIDTGLRALPFPFAGVLLGMGTDGHFASLFPDADGLDAGLDVEAPRLCMPVITAASPHVRLTLTLAALTRSDEIVLLIFGDEKRRILDAALADARRYPVSRLLRQKRARLRVLWAP